MRTAQEARSRDGNNIGGSKSEKGSNGENERGGGQIL